MTDPVLKNPRLLAPSVTTSVERSSWSLWALLAGVGLAHLNGLSLVSRFPASYGPLDWVLMVGMVLLILGMALAYLVGWSSRRVISLLLVSSVVFQVLSLTLALFDIGTTRRIELQLMSVTFWSLGLQVLGSVARVSPNIRLLTQLLPLFIVVLGLLFAATPQGQSAESQIWTALLQQGLAGLMVLMLAPALTELQTRLNRAREDQQFLSRLAFFDDLTGLNNRTFLDQRLQELCAAGEDMAVLFLDLDGFKSINDTLGHATGDEVLRQLSARLNEIGHATACLARVSGDEFAIVLTGRTQQEITKFAEWVVAELSSPMMVAGNLLRLGVSIGISRFPEDAGNAHDLLLRADRAMYAVKRTSKNGFRFYGESQLGLDEQRKLIEGELREAQQRGEFFLMFQPICDLQDGNPRTVEVLLRWQHPTLGRVGPDVFIPIAEESGLIASIGEWVITSALAAAQVWQAEGFEDLRLAVNVSPLQLMQPGFVDMVERQLDNFGLSPHILELEVTEGVELHERSQVMHSLMQLRELGVILSLDDFGTGFASLSRLNELPVQVVKIDKLFVADLTGDAPLERSRYVRTLIKAMVSVASTLELALVVEGVETDEQRQQLLALGCNRAQGYFFARPMTEDELRGRLWTQDWGVEPKLSFVPRLELESGTG